MANFSELNTSGETYSKASYKALDIGQHRIDYPAETKAFTNEQLFNLVMSTDDDMSPEAWQAFFLSHSGQAPSIKSVAVHGDNAMLERTGNVQAIAFALKGGSALNALLSGIADRKAAERMGSIEMMAFLLDTYSDDEQHCIPIVGSKQGKVEDGGTGNKPFDKYTRSQKTADGNRMVPASWYTDVVHTTDEYAFIQRAKAFLNGEEVESMEGIPDGWKAILKTGEAEAVKKTLTDRVSDMRTGLTKGSMLLHHAEAINELSPPVFEGEGEERKMISKGRIHVKMPFRQEYVLDSNGKKIKIGTVGSENEYKKRTIVTGPKIRIQDPEGEHEDKVYSVGSFLQLKPEALAAMKPEERTIVTLDATTKRPPKKPGEGTATGQNEAKVPTTTEGGLTLFNALASYLDNSTDTGQKNYASILEAISKPDGEEAVMSIGKLCQATDALWNVVEPLYLAVQQKKAQAAIEAATKLAKSKGS